MKASLISIGDELLLGEIVDTNSAHLCERLRELGIQVQATQTVGDELSKIIQAFRHSMKESDLVITTGGLGPTDDDLTLAALAGALGLELEFRQEVLESMAKRLGRAVKDLSESNRKQAWVPKGADVLQNDWGTAPGVRCVTTDGKWIYVLPGVPTEMKNIFRERITSDLRARAAGNTVLVHLLHTFGTRESVIGDRIKAWMQPEMNPDVGTKSQPQRRNHHSIGRDGFDPRGCAEHHGTRRPQGES